MHVQLVILRPRAAWVIAILELQHKLQPPRKMSRRVKTNFIMETITQKAHHNHQAITHEMMSYDECPTSHGTADGGRLHQRQSGCRGSLHSKGNVTNYLQPHLC